MRRGRLAAVGLIRTIVDGRVQDAELAYHLCKARTLLDMVDLMVKDHAKPSPAYLRRRPWHRLPTVTTAPLPDGWRPDKQEPR